MSANVIDKGSCGPQIIVLRPPEDLVRRIIDANHHASHDELFNSLRELMDSRKSSYFVAVLPCLVIFGLSSDIAKNYVPTQVSWAEGYKVIIWSHDKNKRLRVCQPLPPDSPTVLEDPSLEDWIQSGCVPEGTEKLLILASEEAVRSCERWKEASIEQMPPTEFSDLGKRIKAKHDKDTATTPGSPSKHQKGVYLDGEI